MKSNTKWVSGLIMAVMCFSWGLNLYLKALADQQELPPTAPGRPVSFVHTLPLLTFAEYQVLASGKMFFGKGSEPSSVEETQPFQTQLVLWGIIKGVNSKAVIGTDRQSNVTTWIVRVGDEVSGERITKISEDSIWVRNKTGEGRIVLSD